MITSNLPLIFSKILLWIKVISTLFCLAFSLASFSASNDMSDAVTFEFKCFFKAIAIAPLPVPISKIFILF